MTLGYAEEQKGINEFKELIARATNQPSVLGFRGFYQEALKETKSKHIGIPDQDDSSICSANHSSS